MAILFDYLQAEISLLHSIPVVGNLAGSLATFFIDVWAFLSIWLGFKLADPNISFMRPKKALTLFGGAIIEIIPILNILPAWTLSVVLIIIMSRGEEALVNTLEKVAGGAQIAGKVAKLAAKVAPNPALRAGLKGAGEAADKVGAAAKGASEKAKKMQKPQKEDALPAQNEELSPFDRYRNQQTGQSGHSQTQGGGGSRERSSNIGAPPVFHQGTQSSSNIPRTPTDE